MIIEHDGGAVAVNPDTVNCAYIEKHVNNLGEELWTGAVEYTGASENYTVKLKLGVEAKARRWLKDLDFKLFGGF